MLLIVYMSLFIISIQSTIVDRGPYQLVGGANYQWMDFQFNNLGAIDSYGNMVMWKILNQSTNYQLSSYQSPLANSPSVKLSTNIWNTNLPQGKIIVYDSNTIYYCNLNLSYSCSSIYNRTTNLTIINSCFGGNLSELYILVFNSSMAGYQVFYFVSTVVNKTSLAIPATSVHKKMIYKNSALYINFQTGIVILSGNSMLNSLKTINFTSTYVNYIDMSVDTLIFAYSYNQSIYILATADFRTIWQKTLNQYITGIKIIDCYLFVYANPYVYQIDLQLGEIVHTLTYGPPDLYLIDYLSNSNIYLYLQDNKSHNRWYLLEFTTEYITNTSACLTNYTYFSFNRSCVRNCSASVIVNNTNLSNPPSTNTNATNSTNATAYNQTNTTNINNGTNLTNATNVTITNITNSTVPPADNTNTSSNNNNYQNNIVANNNQSSLAYSQIFDKIDAIGFANSFGQSMAFTSFKITPNFLLAFTVFLDDLWFYRYHRTIYPVPAQWFMKEVDVINSVKVSPWFLDFIKAINDNYICTYQNQQRYQYLKFSNNDPHDVYFLYSSQNIYQGSLLLNVLFLAVLKVLSLITNAVQKRWHGKIIKSIANGLKYNTRLWVLFIAVIESNTILLSFNAFVQLLSNGLISIQDKFNLLATLSFLFVLLFYTFCFYPLIFTWESKQCSSILLIKCKYKLGGFYLESLNLVCRNLIRGFVNSFFISNYPLQISLLTAIDLIFVFISFKTFKFYKYKIVGALCVLYYVAFFHFDLYFTVKQIFPQSLIQSWDSEMVSLIILITLACTAILISLSLLLINIFRLIKLIIKKYVKKIQDISSAKSRKQQTKEEIKESRKKKSKSDKNISKKNEITKNKIKSSQKQDQPSDKKWKNKIKIISQKKCRDMIKIENCAPTPLVQYSHFKVIVKIKERK